MSSRRRGNTDESHSEGSENEQAVEQNDGFDLESYVAGVTHDLDDEVQALFERRGGSDVREIALKKLVEGTQKAYCHAFVLGNTQDLMKALRDIVSSPCSNAEQVNSCHFLQLAALTCSDEWASYYKELAALMKKSILTSTAPEQQVASITTLGLITFLWAEAEDTVDVLKFLGEIIEEYFENESNEEFSILIATLKAWGFLVSTVDTDFVVDDLVPSHISTIVSFLENADPDVKITAGETLALLVECIKSVEGESYDPHYFNGYFNVQDVLADLYDLANGNPRIVPKKFKGKYKALEPVVKTFEEGESPVITLTFKGQRFTFDTWYESKQLDYLRGVLSVGFQHHFLYNGLLRSIFGVTIKDDWPTLSGSEKKAHKIVNAKVTKIRKNQIKKGRRNKQEAQDDF